MQRQRPDDQRAGLRACITARVGQHRNKCNQDRDRRQRILEFSEDSAGDHVRHHQHDQPDDPVADHPDDRCLQVWRILRRGRRHLLKVFGCLLRQDIDGVIYRNDADQPVLRVEDRQRREIIAVKQLCRVLPILRGVDRNHVTRHDLADLRIPLAQKHLADCDDAEQLLGRIRHIAGVEVLAVLAIRADPANRLHNRHVRAQPDILRRHNRPGTVLRVFQKGIDILAVLRPDLAQHPADDIGRHLLQHVDGIVRVHFRQDVLDLLVGKVIQELLLFLRLHLAEGVCRLILGQDPEQNDPLFVRKCRQNLRDIDRLHVSEGLLQSCNVMLCKKRLNPLYSLFNCHMLSFSFN